MLGSFYAIFRGTKEIFLTFFICYLIYTIKVMKNYIYYVRYCVLFYFCGKMYEDNI